MHEIYHNTACEHCGADLTQPGAVDVAFSNGNQRTNSAPSQVSRAGLLADATQQISIGMHAGSECVGCGELLAETEPSFDNTQALAEGWDLFALDGRIALNRINWPELDKLGYDEPKFDTDADAIIFVAVAASAGSAYHRDAIERIGMLAD